MTGQPFYHLVGKRQGCRQPRRFDPVQVDQPRHAVYLGTLYDKIGGRLRRSADLRPDSGITRLQRTVPQFGPVGADRGIERITTRRIDRIIDLGNPLYIRAETRLTREVEGDVKRRARWVAGQGRQAAETVRVRPAKNRHPDRKRRMESSPAVRLE